MNRHSAEIRILKGLNEEPARQGILRGHFGRADVRVLYKGVLGELGGVNDAWLSEIEREGGDQVRVGRGGRSRKLRGGGALHREAAGQQRHEVHPQGDEAPPLRD